MTSSLLALLLIPLGYVFLWPLTALWLQDSNKPPLQIFLTALSLSMGLLTIVMMWAGLLPGSLVRPLVPLTVIIGGLGIGLFYNRDWIELKGWWSALRHSLANLIRLDFDSLLLWILIIVLAIMLINTLYYPFIGDDTLSRYGLQAKWIYTQHRIPESLSGYPPLAPLTIVSTWFAAGGVNEHLAKLFAFVSSFGMLGATYLLGKKMDGKRTGLLSACLVALTPVFVNNGTIAYVDIPTVFPILLANLFLWQWWEEGSQRDVLIAGLLMSIAMLTKQSALTFVASSALLILLGVISRYRNDDKHASSKFWTTQILFLLPIIGIAGPWYARNYIIGGIGNILPVAGEYHLLEGQASISYLGLIPTFGAHGFFSRHISFALAFGWVFGLLEGVIQLKQFVISRTDRFPVHLVFLIMIVPYWAAWWLFFAFDIRFLIFLLPFMAIWTGWIINWLIQQLEGRVALPRVVWQGVFFVLMGFMIFTATKGRLGGVYYAITDPFATEDERIIAAKGRMYELVVYIRENVPPGTAIVVMDGRMEYYLQGYAVRVTYPLTLADLDGYDYIVHSSGFTRIYESPLGWNRYDFYQKVWSERYFESVYESDGVHVMRILYDDFEDRREIAAKFGEQLPEK